MDLIYNVDKQKCLRNIIVKDVQNSDISPSGVLTINIPAIINGESVVSIGHKNDGESKPFVEIDRSSLTYMYKVESIKFIIESGPKKIRNMHCKGSRNITITIPDSITEIDENSFRYVSFLNIDFDKNSKLSMIKNNAFIGCKFKSKFILPAKCKYIGEAAFCNCVFSEGFEIEKKSKLKIVSRKAFFNAKFHTECLTLPNSLVFVCALAFSECSKLTKVIFEESSTLNVIEEEAFSKSYVQEITINNSNKEFVVKKSCFANMNHLKFLDISNTLLKYLPLEFCEHSYNLQTVVLPNSLITIGEWAFAYNQLSQIEFPSSLEKIGIGAFKGNKLTKISFKDNKTSLKIIGNGAFSQNKLTEIPNNIFSNIELCDNFAFEDNEFSKLSLLPPQNSSAIKKGIFANNKCLSEVILVNSTYKWKKIYDRMFLNCKNLKVCTLPSTVKTLASYCFAGTGFENISLDNIKTINIGVFYGCKNLICCDLSKSNIKKISAKTFVNNKSLKNVKLPCYMGTASKKAFDSSYSDEEIHEILSSSPFINII